MIDSLKTTIRARDDNIYDQSKTIDILLKSESNLKKKIEEKRNEIEHRKSQSGEIQVS